MSEAFHWMVFPLIPCNASQNLLKTVIKTSEATVSKIKGPLLYHKDKIA